MSRCTAMCGDRRCERQAGHKPAIHSAGDEFSKIGASHWSATDDLYDLAKWLPPAPCFDRLAVWDIDVLGFIERREPDRLLNDYGLAFGLPVIVDPNMAPGVVELRNGDEVVERLILPPETMGRASG